MDVQSKKNLVRSHAESGKWVEVNGEQAFVFEQGEGVTVVCLHGVPASSNRVFGLPEARAYLYFLKREDNGASFLKIMRSFEANADKEKLYLDALRALDVPKQMIWGIHDKGLTLEKYGVPLQKALRLDKTCEVQGSHFIQEDCATAISDQVLALIAEPKP